MKPWGKPVEGAGNNFSPLGPVENRKDFNRLTNRSKTRIHQGKREFSNILTAFITTTILKVFI